MRLGINGDPLAEGKLDLPEILQKPSIDEQSWAKSFIAERKWREAVTYRETAPTGAQGLQSATDNGGGN